MSGKTSFLALALFSPLFWCCALLIVTVPVAAAPVDVEIGGLYPMSTATVITGPQRAAMARLAVDFIRDDPTFNASINFSVDFEDDRGDVTQSFINSLDMVQNKGYKALLGPNRSSQSQLVSAVGSAFKVPLVSYASSSPTLSSKNDYPWFFRTCPSDNQQTQVWVSLMQQYDWKQCAVLASNDAYGSGVSSALLNDAAAAGIAISTVAYFSPTDTDFTVALNTIARSKAKIIILAAIAGGGGRIALKQAVLKGMMGSESGYTWIIPEGSASQALLLSAGTESETSLSNAAFRRALMGNLATKPRGGAGPLWDSLMATWTSGSLNTTLFPGSPDPSIVSSDVYVPYSVDAVYTLAHAYLSIVQNGLDINSTNLKNALVNISFVGVTGPVLFNSQFDRIVPYSIVNVRDTSSLFDTVGEWSSSGGTASLVMSTDPVWPDGTTKVPGDGLPRTLYWIKWSSPTSVVILIFVGIAIAICFATIILVAKFSATPVMRLASPTFLMITLVGLSLFFSSLVPWMGAPSEASCNLRNWLGHLGICLALASIIAKTYRVDVIFRKRTKIKKVVVTNIQLVKYVALIMVPITALLIVWAIIDRAKPRRTIDTAENRINLTCGSKSSAWLIAAFVYDALLMVLSLILSFRTRRVPDGFNETWYIYLSGYNTVVMGVVGVTLGYVLMKNLVAMTIVVSVTQLLGGLGLWALIFLPKLYIALIVPDQNSVNLKSAKTTRTLSSRSIGPEISHWKSNIDSTDSDTNSKKVRTESKMDSDLLDPPKAEEGAEKNNKATELKERKKAATDGNKTTGRSQRKKKVASNKETPKSEDNGDATS